MPVVLRSFAVLALALVGNVAVGLLPAQGGAGEGEGYGLTLEAVPAADPGAYAVTATLTHRAGPVAGERLDLALVGVGGLAGVQPPGPHAGTCLTDPAGRCEVQIVGVLDGEAAVAGRSEPRGVSARVILGD